METIKTYTPEEAEILKQDDPTVELMPLTEALAKILKDQDNKEEG